MKITLVIPSYGGGVNVERTIESCRHVCDETIIISTALFDEDRQHFRRIADKVVELPWNFTFLHGHGELHNQATAMAKNDWLLLLGTAETFAEPLMPVAETLVSANPREMFRCNHHNDPHSWKRVWNRTSGVHWSGIMHEELTGGDDGRLLFRMQDTEKTPSLDAFKDEARRWIKSLSYQVLYRELLHHPERLGAASSGWLKFVKGGDCLQFCEDNKQMISACIEGDLLRFLKLVEQASQCKEPYGVNFKPQGYESLIA